MSHRTAGRRVGRPGGKAQRTGAWPRFFRGLSPTPHLERLERQERGEDTDTDDEQE